MANDRITQLPVEVAVDPEPNARTTQVPVEVAVEPSDAKARPTQLPVEVAVDVNPPTRVSSAPVEVLVSPDNAPVRVSGEPVEVLVKPLSPPVRVSAVPVEVLRSSNKVTLVSSPATATVSMADVDITVESFIIDLPVEPDDTDVAAVAPELALTYAPPAAEAPGAEGEEVGISYSYTVAVYNAQVEMPDVTLVELGEENFIVTSAELSVEMPDVGYFEVPITVIPGGSMGAEAMPLDLFGLLTLKVNTATMWAQMVPPALKYYRSPKSRLRSIFRPIFPEKQPSFGMAVNHTVTLKVQPASHRIFKVAPAPPFAHLSVECVPVLFEERTSALWGDLREKSTVEQARELMALGLTRPRVSVKVPRARPRGK